MVAAEGLTVEDCAQLALRVDAIAETHRPARQARAVVRRYTQLTVDVTPR